MTNYLINYILSLIEIQLKKIVLALLISMYRNFASNNTRTTANLLGLKYLLKDFSDIPTKKFTILSADEVNQLLIIQELNSKWTFVNFILMVRMSIVCAVSTSSRIFKILSILWHKFLK